MAEDEASKEVPLQSSEWTTGDLVDRFKTATDYIKPITEYIKRNKNQLKSNGNGSVVWEGQSAFGSIQLIFKKENEVYKLYFISTDPLSGLDRVRQTFSVYGGGTEENPAPAMFMHQFEKEEKGKFHFAGKRSIFIAEGAEPKLEGSLSEIDESLQALKDLSQEVMSRIGPRN